MTRHLFFEGDINHESVKTLTNELDQAAGDGVDVTLFFSSGGGALSDCDVLIRVVRQFPGNLRIVVTWCASSCAFTFLYMVNRDVEFFPHTLSRVHLCTRTVETRDLADPLSSEHVLMKSLDERNEKQRKALFPFLTKAEKMQFNRGFPVTLEGSRAGELVYAIRENLGIYAERWRGRGEGTPRGGL